jgi:hypothetical protein
MKDQTEFYRQRIAETELAIDAAVLDNVRNQATVARDRWIALLAAHVRALAESAKVRNDKLARDQLAKRGAA